MKEHNWQRIREIGHTHVVEQCTDCDILSIVDLDMPDTRLDYTTWPKRISYIDDDCDTIIVKNVMDS